MLLDVRTGSGSTIPDRAQLADVRCAQAVGGILGGLDVPTVVVQLGDTILSQGVQKVVGWTNVARHAEEVGSIGPPGTGARVLGALLEDGVEGVEAGGGEAGPLGLDEPVGVGLGGELLGSEDGAFVCRVTNDGRDLDELAGRQRVVGVVGQEILVERGAPEPDGRLAGSRVGQICCAMGLLKVEGGHVAQAGETGFGGRLRASSVLGQRFEHELRLRNGSKGRSGGRLCGDGVEEIVVPASIGDELEDDRTSTCRGTAESDVPWISAEARNVLLHPLKHLSLVEKAGVEGVGRVGGHFAAGQEAVGTYAVVEVDDDGLHGGSLDELGAVEVGIRVAIEAAALDEDVDGEFVGRLGSCGREDIDEETVLGLWTTKFLLEVCARADADGTKLRKEGEKSVRGVQVDGERERTYTIGVQRPAISQRVRWCSKSICANGSPGIPDSLPAGHAGRGIGDAFDLCVAGVDDDIDGMGAQGEEENEDE